MALIGHQPGQLQAGAAEDLARERDRLLRRADRRALGADLQPAAERPPVDVELDRDPDRMLTGARGVLDQVEMLDRVGHQYRRPAPRAVPARRSPCGRRSDMRSRGRRSRAAPATATPAGCRSEGRDSRGREPGSAPARAVSAPTWRPRGSAFRAARRSMSSEFAHIASRSTSANGASMPVSGPLEAVVIAPKKPGGKGVGHQGSLPLSPSRQGPAAPRLGSNGRYPVPLVPSTTRGPSGTASWYLLAAEGDAESAQRHPQITPWPRKPPKLRGNC